MRRPVQYICKTQGRALVYRQAPEVSREKVDKRLFEVISQTPGWMKEQKLADIAQTELILISKGMVGEKGSKWLLKPTRDNEQSPLGSCQASDQC